MSEINITKEFDILEVVKSYVKVENNKAICPFHADDDPSMSVNPDLGIFKCFGAGCGVGGNAVKFVSLIEDISYHQALEKLARKYNKLHIVNKVDNSSELYLQVKTLHRRVAQIYHKILMEDPRAKEAREYLKKRGISRKTTKKLLIGYAPKAYDFLLRFDFDEGLLKEGSLIRDDNKAFFRNRIIFPISQGEYIVGLMGRTLSDNSKIPKYLNSRESDWFHKKDIIYGWDINKSHIRKAGKLIVVEGQFDVAQLIERGINIGLAVSGSYFNEQQAYQLSKKVKDILVFCDGDKAGFQFGLNVGQMFLSQGKSVKIAFKLKKDPDDLLRESRSFKEAISGITYDYLEFLYRFGKAPESDLLKEAIKRLSTVKDDFVKLTMVRQLSKLSKVPEEELFPLVNRYQVNPYAFNTKPKEVFSPSIETCLLAALYVSHGEVELPPPSNLFREEINQLISEPGGISADLKLINSSEFVQLITMYSKYLKKDKERLISELYNQYKIKNLQNRKQELKADLKRNPDKKLLETLSKIDNKIEELSRG